MVEGNETTRSLCSCCVPLRHLLFSDGLVDSCEVLLLDCDIKSASLLRNALKRNAT